MTEVTVWFNPSCSKCRTVEGILAARGVDADYIHYLDDAPDRAALERVLALLGTDDPLVIARVEEPLFAEIGLDGTDRKRLLDALTEHPTLIQRPIVIAGGRAVVARPPERVTEILEPVDDP